MKNTNIIPILAIDDLDFEIIAQPHNGHANVQFFVGEGDDRRIVASVRLTEPQVFKLSRQIDQQIGGFKTQEYVRGQPTELV